MRHKKAVAAQRMSVDMSNGLLAADIARRQAAEFNAAYAWAMLKHQTKTRQATRGKRSNALTLFFSRFKFWR